MDPYAGFAAIYERWSAPMTDDVAFYVDLAHEVDGPIVELAVGTGRVAIPVAAATGQRVIGIDVSLSMLEIAREQAAAAGVELDLRLGDMRDFSLDEPELDGKWHTDTGVPHRIDYFPPDNRVTVTLEDDSAVTLWWIARSEWEGLIDVAGLEVEALYGWFDRRPFDDTSRELVWVARKPA